MKLVELLCSLSENRKLVEFLDKSKIELARLTDAYVSSRYFARDFYRDEAEEALKLLRELRKAVGWENG